MFPPTRVARDGDAGAVEVLVVALAGDPLGDAVVLLDGDGVPGLGRQVVLGEDDRRPRADRELADEPVVGVGVAEDPAGAVEVEDDGKRPGDPRADGRSGRVRLRWDRRGR
ncbi:hypothetical protein GCM10019017_24310 [Streptomyces showdoensis]